MNEVEALWRSVINQLSSSSADTFLYNTMLSIYGKRERLNSIDVILSQMQTRHVEWNAHTYSILLSTFSKMGDMQRLEEVRRRLTQEPNSMELDAAPFNTILHAYCNNVTAPSTLQTEKIGKVLGQMIQRRISPNVVTYTTLLAAYIKAGKDDLAEAVISEMKTAGIKWNWYTYGAVLDSYVREKKVTKAEELWNTLRKEFSEVPKPSFWVKMVRLYSDTKNWDKLSELANEMKTTTQTLGTEACNAFIDGYGQAGNLIEVNNILRYMQKRQVTQTEETFEGLLMAFSLKRSTEQSLLALKRTVLTYEMFRESPGHTPFRPAYNRALRRLYDVQDYNTVGVLLQAMSSKGMVATQETLVALGGVDGLHLLCENGVSLAPGYVEALLVSAVDPTHEDMDFFCLAVCADATELSVVVDQGGKHGDWNAVEFVISNRWLAQHFLNMQTDVALNVRVPRTQQQAEAFQRQLEEDMFG